MYDTPDESHTNVAHDLPVSGNQTLFEAMAAALAPEILWDSPVSTA